MQPTRRKIWCWHEPKYTIGWSIECISYDQDHLRTHRLQVILWWSVKWCARVMRLHSLIQARCQAAAIKTCLGSSGLQQLNYEGLWIFKSRQPAFLGFWKRVLEYAAHFCQLCQFELIFIESWFQKLIFSNCLSQKPVYWIFCWASTELKVCCKHPSIYLTYDARKSSHLISYQVLQFTKVWHFLAKTKLCNLPHFEWSSQTPSHMSIHSSPVLIQTNHADSYSLDSQRNPCYGRIGDMKRIHLQQSTTVR